MDFTYFLPLYLFCILLPISLFEQVNTDIKVILTTIQSIGFILTILSILTISSQI